MLEGASGFNIGLCLLTHQAKFSPLTLVVSDKGTAMAEGVVNIRTEDGQGIFDAAIFPAHSVDSKQKKTVERQI